MSEIQNLDNWQVPAGTSKHSIRIQSLVIVENNRAIFDETTLIVEIADEAAGEYVKLSEPTGSTKVGITVKQWPVVRDAIDFMVQHCREDKDIRAHEDSD